MTPPIDYETMKLIWGLLLGVLLIGYAVTDGFDMGVGALLPYVGRTDEERRLVINSVGPVWEGNQVWLVLGIGAIFAAWPAVYGTAFSGFYTAMFFILVPFIIRPVSFVYRSKNPNTSWRNFWDWGLFISGVVPAFMFGLLMGNILQGFPFHFTVDMRAVFGGSFFELFNPFALLAGMISLAMTVQHGAAWLVVKTDGAVQCRSKRLGMLAGLLATALFLFAGLAVWSGWVGGYIIKSGIDPNGPAIPLAKTVIRSAHAWTDNFGKYPLMWIAPLTGVLGLFFAAILVRFGKGKLSLFVSGLGIAGVISTQGLAMFPFILPSSSYPGSSLTVWDSSSSHLTLFIMLIATIIFMPLILIYTSWVYYIIRGKVNLETLLGSKESY